MELARGYGDDDRQEKHPACHAVRPANPKGRNGQPAVPPAAVYPAGHRPPRPVPSRDTAIGRDPGRPKACRRRDADGPGALPRGRRDPRTGPLAQRLIFTASLVEKVSSVPSLTTAW